MCQQLLQGLIRKLECVIVLNRILLAAIAGITCKGAMQLAQRWYILKKYISLGEGLMQIARIFKNGRSQAVRLPKEYRLEGDRVSITRVGEAIVLQPIHSSWVELHRLISPFPILWKIDVIFHHKNGNHSNDLHVGY